MILTISIILYSIGIVWFLLIGIREKRKTPMLYKTVSYMTFILVSIFWLPIFVIPPLQMLIWKYRTRKHNRNK